MRRFFLQIAFLFVHLNGLLASYWFDFKRIIILGMEYAHIIRNNNKSAFFTRLRVCVIGIAVSQMIIQGVRCHGFNLI